MLEDFAGNSFETATSLNLTPSPQTFTSSLSPLDTRDYYSSTLSAASSLNLSLSGLSANADVELLNNLGEVLQTSARTDTIPESLFTTLDAGTSYIQVHSGAETTNPYNLSLSATPNPAGALSQTGDILTGFGNPKFDTGVFTVGSSGQVSIDYLLDGGLYQGELAIFSLEGMDQFDLGSDAFFQEAARRALSDSQLGHVVISDAQEGARFHGSFPGEGDFNFGDYQGVKTFSMRPGDEFGVMLVPDGTVQQVFDNPTLGGDVRPLFSLATANPNDAFHVGQIADVTGDGNTFVMEDLRVDGWIDRDYNDLIFQVTGATGKALHLDELIAPGKDWRGSELGKELVDYVKLPNPIPTPRDGLMAEVGSDLASLQAEYEAYLEQPTNPSGFQTSNSLLQVYDGGVVIDAVAADDANALLAELNALGLQNGSTFGAVVSGVLPIESIDEMADLDSLRFARPAYQPLTNVGLTTSQGDVAMNADDARAFFGVDGTGVTVGVLSDSFNALGGAADDIASGDLPTGGINVLEDSSGIDEGRAMLQLIHDVAPGADLAFHTAKFGIADFANAILELANAGADVIVDDVSYLTAPMFQDGLVAQAVDTVVANGVSYFSSAGNMARNSYESPFRDSGIIYSPGYFTSVQLPPNSGFFVPYFYGGTAHDFDPSPGIDIFQSFSLAPEQSFRTSFQWDEAFFSVSGGAGVTNEMDIYILDENDKIVGGKADSNFGGDAVEVFGFTNTTGATANYKFMIVHDTSFGGTPPGQMKYVLFDQPGSKAPTINEFATNSSTIFGHANAKNAIAVGAARYDQTPEFNPAINPPVLEDFSSYGSTPILFDINGNRLATPEIRQNPDIVAPDGANTTFFGQDVPFNSDGFPNFFGTSAAAPHAAAVAALMLDAAPGTSPNTIYQALKDTAIDMDDPSTPGMDVGFDNATGYGFIDAALAIQALVAPTITINATQPQASEEPGNPGQFTVTRTGSTASPLTLNYTITGTATNGTDYSSLSGSVTIPAGLSSFRIPLIPIDDMAVEGNETVELTLTPNLIYKIDPNSSSATVTISDNDRPAVTISATDPNASEAGSDAAEFTITRNSNVGDLTINYTVTGSATNGTDYNLLSGSVTIPNGSTTATISLIPIDDTAVEGNETVVVNLQTNSNYSVGTANSATVAIADNDFSPPVSAGNDFIDGGDGNNIIYGGAGNDTIYGGSGNDIIHGGPGDDVIYAGDGNNIIYGGGGNDTIYSGSGNDIIYGGDGVDTIIPSSGNNLVEQDGSNGSTYGTPGVNPIYGTSGNDTLNGTAGNETIIGLEGDDTIYGGGGSDILFGDTPSSSSNPINNNPIPIDLSSSPYEPNNSLNNAYNLGTLSSTPITVRDYVSSTDTDDYYRFNVSQPGQVKVTISNLSPGSTLGGEIISISGGSTSQSSFTVSSGGTNSISNSVIPGGTNYIRLYRLSGDSNYTFDISN